MMLLVYGLMAGLLLGLSLRWSMLTDRDHFRLALSLRASTALRTVLAFLGWGAVMTAFLGWLAVLDVDLLAVSPLSGAVLIGGAVTGFGAALCGRTPLTALGGVGGGRFLESLCTVAGCVLGTLAYGLAGDLFQPLTALAPRLEGTFFRVTLDESFLFQGGFLGQGCVGAVLLALALWISAPQQQATQEEAPAREESSPETEILAEPKPDDLSEEVVVMTLEGEEPLIIDPEEEPKENDWPESEWDEPPEEEPESPDV